MFRRKIKDIQEHAKNRGISMERRLFLYWLIMVLAVMTAVFVVLIVAGVFSNDAGKLGGTLSVQQKNTTMTFNKLIDTLNAQNLALSEQITREVSDVLETSRQWDRCYLIEMTRQVTKASCGDPQSVTVDRRQTLRPDRKSPKSRPRSRARGVLRLNAGESTPKSYRQIASKLKSACGRRPTGR